MGALPGPALAAPPRRRPQGREGPPRRRPQRGAPAASPGPRCRREEGSRTLEGAGAQLLAIGEGKALALPRPQTKGRRAAPLPPRLRPSPPTAAACVSGRTIEIV